MIGGWRGFAQEVLALKQCGQISYHSRATLSHWRVSHCVQCNWTTVCFIKCEKGMNSVEIGAKSSTKANCSPCYCVTTWVTNLLRLHVLPIIILFLDGEQKDNERCFFNYWWVIFSCLAVAHLHATRNSGKRSYLHQILHEYTWAEEEQRAAKWILESGPPMGRWAYEDEILCLHNNTYSAAFRRVEYSVTLPDNFRATGATATLLFFAHFRRSGRTKCWHEALLLLKLLLFHNKHKHFLQGSSLSAVATLLSWKALIRGWCANLSRILIEPAPSALMGLPEKKKQKGRMAGTSPPRWLAVNHCHSLRDRLSSRPAAVSWEEAGGSSTGGAKYLQANCKSLIFGELPKRTGWRNGCLSPGLFHGASFTCWNVRSSLRPLDSLMRQFNYTPLGFARAVELPLQLLLAPWTGGKKPFLVLLFLWHSEQRPATAFVLTDRCISSVSHASRKVRWTVWIQPCKAEGVTVSVWMRTFQACLFCL